MWSCRALLLNVVILILINQLNAGKPRVEKLQIGVKKRVATCEEKADIGDQLGIYYTGTLHQDGTKFDSRDNTQDPLAFKLGLGELIAGMDQGIRGMCVGEQRRILIPALLGYGTSGSPPTIPEDADLIFEVELATIKKSKTEL